MSFKNVDVETLRMALRQCAVSKPFDNNFIKNDKNCITIECTNKNYNWRLYASSDRHGETLVIKTLNDNHACRNVNQDGNRMATIRWIERNVKSQVNDDNNVKLFGYQKIYTGSMTSK